MPRFAKLAHAFALGLTLVPTFASAQTCDADDQVFEVHEDGVFPDEIYHQSDIGVCFINRSNQKLYLLYENELGVLTPTLSVQNGNTTVPLVLPGDDAEIFAASELYCGTVEEVRYYRQCNRYSCWYQSYTVDVPKTCDGTGIMTDYNRIDSIAPGRLYEGDAPLSY